MTTLRPSKFWAWHCLTHSLTHSFSLVFAYSHTHTHMRTCAHAIQCMEESIEWSAAAAATAANTLLPLSASFPLLVFVSFVAHHNAAHLMSSIIFFVCGVRASALALSLYIYRPDIQLAREIVVTTGGGHASHRVHFDNAIWVAAMRISRVAFASLLSLLLQTREMNGTGHHAVTFVFLLKLFAQLESNTHSHKWMRSAWEIDPMITSQNKCMTFTYAL